MNYGIICIFNLFVLTTKKLTYLIYLASKCSKLFTLSHSWKCRR